MLMLRMSEFSSGTGGLISWKCGSINMKCPNDKNVLEKELAYKELI
jgi:hypothetical protein